ncbi:MCE family protein [Mycolicibacterium sp. CH28]|uniref:MCE family protein n=1 Tax=Mycolicibacterium sp. CH28 TaxID=2512237 RepID=UPI001080D775|nr:MCE family protein [Mycolicibacterium sp. CH28]TGD89402.1 MCE family protein [Mycolicibacterium sp. CH28]
MASRAGKLAVVAALAILLVVGLAVVLVKPWNALHRTRLVAYFANTNGLFVGDEVRVLGVPVGTIDAIEPMPQRAKVSFWVDARYRIPAGASAAIVAPQLVTARAIQLTPAYTGGPVMVEGTVIPQDRTAVPVEWDDLRKQLDSLTTMLAPTQPGGISTLGAFINTAADNLRGEGADIRKTIIALSQAFSALGDHSDDTFTTVKNLATLVTALRSSTDLMADLNRKFALVTGLLADDPDEVGRAIGDLNTAVADVRGFVADNKEALGVSFDKLSSISTAAIQSLDDIKQGLHIAPNAAQDLSNIYQPAQAALSGALAMNNFANPLSFLCAAIQAASRLGAEQAAKLCVQYLAPIVKNRQFNFLPFGENLLVGAQARPNEITYSEDWMRPDYRPAAQAPVAPLPAEAQVSTDPGSGLPGLMVPQGAGS